MEPEGPDPQPDQSSPYHPIAHCGFKHSDLEMPNKADIENDVILEMHRVGNYEDFSCIDNSLQY
jgi:hypothetical protein